MRYRAHALGGELSLDSIADEGTIVTCDIPIRPILKVPESSTRLSG
jgi:hypothetical protein